MPRRHPGRRGRRPGRRPPNRYGGHHVNTRPEGFTGHGLKAYYDLILPGLRGREKKAFFNEISGWLIPSAAVGGAAAGLALLGPLGAVLGLGTGLAAAASFLKDNRFYRP